MLTRAEINSQDIPALMADMGARARAASRPLAIATTAQKDAALAAVADAIEAGCDDILAANAVDMERAKKFDLTDAFRDRLKLTKDRVQAMADGIRAIAGLTDPVGAIIAAWDRPNGLEIERVRTPLGVIGVIYESRPNVTADAGALCLKAGNAVILRGGSDSANSSRAIHACLAEGLETAGLPADAIQLVPVTDRAAVGELLTGLDGTIDVIVPRGGRSLVERVQSDARVPVFAHLEGLCHIYIDKSRRSRHGAAPSPSTPRCAAPASAAPPRPFWSIAQWPTRISGRSSTTLDDAGCAIRGDADVCAMWPKAERATEADWLTEYLGPLISVALVDGIERRDRPYRHLFVEPYRGGRSPRTPRSWRSSSTSRQRHPPAQRVDAIRRWRGIRHGRGDRHRHRQDACARTRRRRAADILQVPGARHRPDPSVNRQSVSDKS